MFSVFFFAFYSSHLLKVYACVVNKKEIVVGEGERETGAENETVSSTTCTNCHAIPQGSW